MNCNKVTGILQMPAGMVLNKANEHLEDQLFLKGRADSRVFEV